MNLVCEVCADTIGIDADDACCPQCDGRLISSRVLRERDLATEDAVDQLWLAYYAVREGDRQIAATYSEGCLFKRQAGGVR